MKTKKRGDVIRVSWFGWGTMNFVSSMLLIIPPFLVAVLTGGMIKFGIPADPQNAPVVRTLGEPATIALAASLLYATAAFLINWRNTVIIDRRRIRIHQGTLPWLVTFRRRSMALADAGEFKIESVTLGTGGGTTESSSRYCVMLIGRRRRNIRVTGALVHEKVAKGLCEEFNNSLTWARGDHA